MGKTKGSKNKPKGIEKEKDTENPNDLVISPKISSKSMETEKFERGNGQRSTRSSAEKRKLDDNTTINTPKRSTRGKNNNATPIKDSDSRGKRTRSSSGKKGDSSTEEDDDERSGSSKRQKFVNEREFQTEEQINTSVIGEETLNQDDPLAVELTKSLTGSSDSEDESDAAALRILKKSGKVSSYLKKLVQNEMKLQKEQFDNQDEEKQEKQTDKIPDKGNVDDELMPLKSPSNSTIYVPALQKLPTVTRTIGQGEINSPDISPREQYNFQDQIDKFISEIKSQTESVISELERRRNDLPGSSRPDTSKPEKSKEQLAREYEREAVREAREIAENRIIDAEKSKAAIVPPGKISNIPIMAQNAANADPCLRVSENDDEFLSSTCHVDMSTELSIAKSEFLDVSKLIPKKGIFRAANNNNRMEIVNNNGFAVWSEVSDREEKIYNINKWDQGFRVYATIWSKYHPARCAEIFQYIHIIHHAAAKFAWDNVLNYDYMFRRWIARKPTRDWGRTNTEMWSTCMTDPIGRNPNNYNRNNNKKDWRDYCCWRFNRNHCNRGSNCRFEHRCTYCGSYSHPVQSCPKKNRSDDRNGHGSHERRGDRDKNNSHSKHRRSNSNNKDPENVNNGGNN